jgi:hypothetical protein
MRVRAKTGRKINYWLTAGKEYVVIGISGKYYRVGRDRNGRREKGHKPFSLVLVSGWSYSCCRGPHTPLVARRPTGQDGGGGGEQIKRLMTPFSLSAP